MTTDRIELNNNTCTKLRPVRRGINLPRRPSTTFRRCCNVDMTTCTAMCTDVQEIKLLRRLLTKDGEGRRWYSYSQMDRDSEIRTRGGWDLEREREREREI